MSYTELRIVKLTPFKHVKSPQEFINFARENKLDVSIYPGVEEYFDEYGFKKVIRQKIKKFWIRYFSS